MVERILIRVLVLLVGMASMVHIADSGEVATDYLNDLYFVKCVPQQKNPSTQPKGVYLLDGFRFEKKTPLVMEVILTTRIAKNYLVTGFKRHTGFGLTSYELLAKAADGEQLALNINESGITKARLNREMLKPQLLCKVGRS